MRFATLDCTTQIIQPDGYRLFVKHGGKIRRAAASALWWALRKLRALEIYDHTIQIYEFGLNEQKPILEAITDQVQEMARAGYYPKDYCIVCGAKTWEEITGAVVDRHRSFPMELQMRTHRHGYYADLYGIDVHVVPRMDGICMIPKVIVESHA